MRRMMAVMLRGFLRFVRGRCLLISLLASLALALVVAVGVDRQEGGGTESKSDAVASTPRAPFEDRLSAYVDVFSTAAQVYGEENNAFAYLARTALEGKLPSSADLADATSHLQASSGAVRAAASHVALIGPTDVRDAAAALASFLGDTADSLSFVNTYGVFSSETLDSLLKRLKPLFEAEDRYQSLVGTFSNAAHNDLATP